MDPVTLVTTALAAGAGSGLKGAASSVVTDAYQAVKNLARKKLANRPSGQVALVEYENAPETWRAPLAAELREACAGDDAELIKAAQLLMSLLDHAGSNSGKYTVDSRGSQGVQIGDHGTQYNTFNSPRD
jgi:hypothetical protein